MAKRWNTLFKPWILERGQAYYACGQVAEPEADGAVIRAEVYGSQTYQVEIQRSGADVVWMRCDCPYAAGGENCKHMAAVLFAMEEPSAADRMDWQTALEQLPAEKLRELLRSLVEGDGSLQDRIVRIFPGRGMIRSSGRQSWSRSFWIMRTTAARSYTAMNMTAWRISRRIWMNVCPIY